MKIKRESRDKSSLITSYISEWKTHACNEKGYSSENERERVKEEKYVSFGGSLAGLCLHFTTIIASVVA